MLIVHWVIMFAIPFFIVEVVKCYGYATINYGLHDCGNRGDMWGIMVAAIFCMLTVGLYWLLSGPLGYNIKSALAQGFFPDDDLLKILAIAYFIIVKPYVEEWFWRRYNYDIFPYDELHFWLVSFFFALTYTVIALNIGTQMYWALIVCLCFTALGRFLIYMRWVHGTGANYVTHMGIAAGVVVSYFLADAGKF